MTSIGCSDFIKTERLTEMSTNIPNSLWPKIEAYIDLNPEWFENMLSTGKYTYKVHDIEIENIIKIYATIELEKIGVNLDAFSCEFYSHPVDQLQTYGECDLRLLNTSNSITNIKKIKASITIFLYDIIKLEKINTLKTLYHELIHLEEGLKALAGLGFDKLASTLPPFNWIGINDILKKQAPTTDKEYVNSTGERNTLAGSFALQLYYKYKQEFKQQTIKQQEYFIRTQIIPNIKNEFSPIVRDEFFPQLVKSNKLYISLIKQLMDLASRVAKHE